MTRQFFVECEEVCSECNGTKWIRNPLWDELGVFLAQWDADNPHLSGERCAARGERRWQAERGWWSEMHGIEVDNDSRGLPWDEAVCLGCEGSGMTRSRVPLVEALRELKVPGV